jgi:hypothetical protein
MQASIKYGREMGETEPKPNFVFEDVNRVHEQLDLALLKVSAEPNGGSASPPRLPTASIGRKVYVVGYPAWDPTSSDPPTMQRIFADIYRVKRLQPGEIRAFFDQTSIFHHNCSTLGGNSGS